MGEAVLVNWVLIGVILLLIAILIVREIAIRRGLPPSDNRLRGDLEKLQLELNETIGRHTIELVEREATHQETLRTVRAEVDETIHKLELEWAETRRAQMKVSNARSRSALVAKVAEHMSPLLSGFPYNPKDARHVGELFDFLVLDGLEDGVIRKVVFLEVKTRRTGRVSNPRERLLRDAVKSGRVSYEVFVPQVPSEPS